MMTKQIYLIAIAILLPFFLYSQGGPRGNWGGGGPGGQMPQKTITGKIIDSETGQGLEFATVTLFSKMDDKVITGGLTDDKGEFTIETKPGKFKATLEFLSYETIEIEEIKFTRGEPIVNLGEFTMSLSGQVIEGVEVRAERSETIFKLDKKVFSVGKDLANRGGSATEVLDNVPSVTVDVEGNVSLRGSSDVRMLINGQPSTLVSSGNLNGLKSIQANSIDRIEVITNPSAKYEAEGMAGIINIILKKEEQKGFNGSFNAGVGYPFQYNAGAQVNYRKNKTNFFINFSSGLRKVPGGGTDVILQDLGDFSLYTEQFEERDRNGFNNRIQGGIDYNLADNQILTLSGSYSFAEDNNENTVIYDDYSEVDGVRTPLATIHRLDLEGEDETNQEYTLTYKNLFDGNGNSSLTATLFYDDGGEIERSEIRQGTNALDLQPFQLVNINENQNNQRAQIDFTKKLANEFNLETGVRVNLRTITNDYSVSDNIDNSFVQVDSLTDDFEYHEDIYAAYVSLGKSWNKFSLQLGLRAEYTTIETLFQNNVESDTSYNYFSPFPTAHLTYKLNEKNALQISYSKRIERPRFWYLNPFLTLTDVRNRFAGNPALTPEFVDSYEIGHINYFEKGSVSSSLFYKYSTDVIERIRTINQDGTTIIKPENLSSEVSYGLDVSANYSATKWLRLDGNLTFFNYEIAAGDFANTFDASDISWFGRIGSRISFWKNTELQLRFNYRARRESVQGLRKAMYHVDFGLSKDFLNNNLTLTLSSRDLFNTRKRRFVVDVPGYFTEGEFQWRGRTIDLNASYRINQKKKRGGNRGDFQGGEGF